MYAGPPNICKTLFTVVREYGNHVMCHYDNKSYPLKIRICRQITVGKLCDYLCIIITFRIKTGPTYSFRWSL